MNNVIVEIYDSYPNDIKHYLLKFRQIIYEVSQNSDEIGEIEESVKWGQPSYRPMNKSGTTIRLGWSAKKPNVYSIFVPCQTTIIRDFKVLYPNELNYIGNREICFDKHKDIKLKVITEFINQALTYYLVRK